MVQRLEQHFMRKGLSKKTKGTNANTSKIQRPKRLAYRWPVFGRHLCITATPGSDTQTEFQLGRQRMAVARTDEAGFSTALRRHHSLFSGVISGVPYFMFIIMLERSSVVHFGYTFLALHIDVRSFQGCLYSTIAAKQIRSRPTIDYH